MHTGLRNSNKMVAAKEIRKNNAASKYNIPILGKCMALLELISAHPEGLTLQEMVNALKHSKTSVYRIVCSLEEMGYLRKDEATGHFSLTRKLFKLGLSTLGTATIIEHAYEPMRQLRDTIRETVVLGTLIDRKIVILEQVAGSHNFSFMLKPGMEVGLHASAPGKAILAYLDEEECDAILDTLEFEAYNPQTITSKEGFKKELGRVRKSGYGLDWGEELAGVHCIGAPIFNQSGQVMAAVWITGPSERLPEKAVTDFSRQIILCADTISQKIGYRN